MNILTAQDISKTYLDTRLLKDVSFSVQEGDKTGVIGLNGAGKSTLLKILAGLEEPDSGKVVKASRAVARYLPQVPEFDPQETVLKAVMKDIRRQNEDWDREGEARSMLTRLGLADFSCRCGVLSGGQKKRLALAGTLLSGADILLLDEPTNHLDNGMCDWLENYLKSWRGTLVMVTHDRYFLDSVCTGIVEIDFGHSYYYGTNYEGYLERKTERGKMEAASERKRQSILSRELAWVQRGAKARTTKQKGRLQRYEQLKAKSAPLVHGTLDPGSIASRMGKQTIELDRISKAYGNRTLFEDFSYIFLKRDRVGFIGPNGCGKTTLMKIIAGILEPDSGNIVRGQTIKIGCYAQEISFVHRDGSPADPGERAVDYIRDTAEYVHTEEGLVSASGMMERFLFTPEMQYSPISRLSGGEKRRLSLLKVLMGEPNVLILDEPTNDLDIATMMVLEDFLDHFEGIVIAVSHDRYFLDRTMRRIFAFEGTHLVQYEGGYTDYRRKKEEKEKEEISEGGEISSSDAGSGAQRSSAPVMKAGENSGAAAAEKGKKRTRRKIRFTYREQQEYDVIEQEISDLEETAARLDRELESCGSDYVKAADLTARRQETEDKLEKKMDRWAYLEEKAEKISRGEEEDIL